MIKPLLAVLVIILAVVGGFFAYSHTQPAKQEVPVNGQLSLTSSAFEDDTDIPDNYTCKGTNVSPPLEISGVPDRAQSLAIVMHDPDAPGGDFLHWTVWNIPTDTSLIAEKSLPSNSVEGKNDFDTVGYGGPCPPSGTHHYIFELYALDSDTNLESGASRQALDQAMNGHVIGKTTLTGTVAAKTSD